MNLELVLPPFLAGLSCALAIGAVFRVLNGMRLKLQLVNADSAIDGQTVFPLTAENKKGMSLLHTLLSGNWRENIDIVLADDKGRLHAFFIGYHLWWRFYIVSRDGQQTWLDGKELLPNVRHYVRTGMQLRLGNRRFTTLVTTNDVSSLLHKELAAGATSHSD
jgi:hypothetical protein